MEESEIHLYGQNTSEFVKIIDKSKRAYAVDSEAIKSFEIALQKPRNECKHKVTRCRATCYAWWLLCFKHHGKPPTKHLYCWFALYAFFMGLDLILLVNFMFHLMNPEENLMTIGFPFLWLYPLLPFIAPLTGIIAVFKGSPYLMKMYANMNCTLVLFNYFLTLCF